MARWITKKIRSTSSGKLWTPAAWLLTIGLLAAQASLVGHQLSHDNPLADLCAICHISDDSATPLQAAPLSSIVDVYVLAPWVAGEYSPIATESPTFRPGRAPPSAHI